jgi:hypothetical protein
MLESRRSSDACGPLRLGGKWAPVRHMTTNHQPLIRCMRTPAHSQTLSIHRPHPAHRKRLFKTFLPIALALACFSAQAQISVGPNGSQLFTFDTTPPVSQWSTVDILGSGASEFTDAAGLDANVQTRAASLFATTLTTDSAAIPGANRLARRNTSWNALQTVATGSSYTPLMATLRNDTGANQSSITIVYDLNEVSAANAVINEQVPGHRVFFSLTGQPGDWQLIPGISSDGAPGLKIATLNLGSWAPGSLLYILWVDDNGSSGRSTTAGATTEGAYLIDNFLALLSMSAVEITTQPVNQTVMQGRSVTFTVEAQGAALSYQWHKQGTGAIPGATAPSFSITNATFADAGDYYVVVSNPRPSSATSAVARLTVIADNVPPRLVSAISIDPHNVILTFDEPIRYDSIELYDIWFIEGFSALEFAAVHPVSGDPTRVRFVTEFPMSLGLDYEMSVSAVEDVWCPDPGNCPSNTIAPDSRIPITMNWFVVDISTPWKYFALPRGPGNGGSEPDPFGDTWIHPAFNDGGWNEGAGLFGAETAGVYPFPIVTTIPAPNNSGPVNIYFRTAFDLDWTGPAARLRLTSTNYIDDGMVIYLNGTEAARFNMPQGPIAYDRLAVAANPGGEPVIQAIELPAANLVQGRNVLAVSVHNNSATSSDTVFGMRLVVTIIPAHPPSIIVPPAPQVVDERGTLALTVTASGEQLSYRWEHNGQIIPGATNSTYTSSNISPSQAGQYRVEVINPFGNVFSSPVLVTVNPDVIPPSIVSAVAGFNLTNVTVVFSEPISSNSVNLATIQVAPVGGGATLGLESFQIVNGTNLVLTTSPRTQGTDYAVTISGIMDLAASPNTIPPNSQIRPRLQILLLAPEENVLWRYDDSGVDQGTAWRSPGFNDAAWSSGAGLFLATTAASPPTTTDEPIRTILATNGLDGIRVYTYYFRTEFNVPTIAAGGALRIRPIIDDGAVFYVNGQEVRRVGMFPNVEITYFSGANRTQGTSQLYEGPYDTAITSLTPGQHLIAVEVHQVLPSTAQQGPPPPTSSDIAFAVQLIAELESFQGGSTAQPRLNFQRSGNNLVLSWEAAGFRLQQRSSLSSGAWANVPNGGTSPLTLPVGTGTLFLRLTNE